MLTNEYFSSTRWLHTTKRCVDASLCEASKMKENKEIYRLAYIFYLVTIFVTIQVETRIYCVFRKEIQILQCLSPFAEGELIWA